MENFSKLSYFFCSGISALQVLFYAFYAINLWINPYKKFSEAFIFFVASCIAAGGLYFAYKYGFASAQFWTGVGILLASWLLALLSGFVGLLFFNGPINWQ